MPASEHPSFLIVQIPARIPADTYLERAPELLAAGQGKLLAAVTGERVECLEAGTPPASILIAEFDTLVELRASWQAPAHQALWEPLLAGNGCIALGVNGLPYAGLPETPEIPTVASVAPPGGRGPRAYMLVQGSATDQNRMDQYRDIILPMIAAQGAYYIAFEIEGQVERLAGEWPYDIFAISRWPDHASGHAFWDSERYQDTAIPLRTGAGSFRVHFFAGAAG